MDIDYLESLFTGMDIIINERLKDLPYDKTIICTVVNNDNRKNYEYTVSDGSIEFIAYSENDRFLKGDQVLVKIPQGDYTKEKIIEGKYLNKDNAIPTTYISPLDTVVNMTGNLIQSGDNTLYGIKANGESLEKEIWIKTFEDKPLNLITEDGIADTITLKADFKTLLGNFNKGNYGLRLDVCTKKDENKNELILDSYFLDSNEMLGDPYNFLVYTQQEKTFDIITYGYIYLLRLVLYQVGNFEPFEQSQFDNIFVKDIEFGIGSDIIKIEDNTLKIYSADSLDYSSNNPKKNIGLTWYNKDDNNKYIGFSDGIYDPSYNERDYLKVVAADARLLAQQGREDIPKDKESLTLAANIEEGKQGVKKALKLISEDIHQELINLILQLDDIKDLKSSIRKFNDQTLEDYYNDINDELTLVEEDYKSTLEWRYNKGKETKPSLKGSLSVLKGYFESFNTEIENMFSNLLESIESNYKGYKGIYETYKIRVERILAKIDKIINNLVFFETDKDEEGSIFFIDQKRLEKETIENEVFEKSEYTEYANKYAIYWYRYNKNASGDEFMPEGWEELTNLAGIGLPGEESGTGFYQKSLAAGTYTEIEMNGNQIEEKFIVILFYNHIMYKSNELVFSNTDKVKALTDQGDAIVIQHHDESYNDYYIYNLTGVLNNVGDSSKVRRLRCHYDGLLSKDEILQDAEIYWYVPTQNSMIVVNQKTLKNNGFSTDIEDTLLIPGYDCYYKTIKFEKDENENENIKETDDRDFYYLINSYYMETASINNIICKVKLANTDNYLQAQVSLSFGISGTSGTQYNLIVKEAEPNKISTTDSIVASDESLILDGSLTLDISLRDYQNEKVPILYDENPDGTVLATSKGSTWLINMSENKSESISLITSGESNEFIGAKIPAGSYGILNTIITFTNPDQNNKLMDLESYHPIPWSTSLNYYISGPVRIIYNSLGTLDDRSVYKKKYQLFNCLTNEEITNIKWIIEYYVIINEEAVKLDDLDSGNEELKKLKSFYNNYMPKLVNDTLVPASLYLDGLDCYALVKAIKEIDDNNYEVQWIQPIVITQNRYASSLLNDWDGSFQINEEGGTILSTMVGAGRKTSKNTFSGVLMGDVGVASGDNKTELGLYGFHNGAQSFGFNVDGTAFLGKSGSGRIYFNGDKGVISSPGWILDKTNGWSLSSDRDTGTLLDLDDAQLLLKGKNGYLYFNDNNDGMLKMSLKGANIYLTDQKSNLNGYIDITREGIISNFTQKANYYCECRTYAEDGPIKWLRLQADDYKNIKSLMDEEGNIILKNGFTVSVSFAYGNSYFPEENLSFSFCDTSGKNGFGKPIIIINSKTLNINAGENLIFTYDEKTSGFELTVLSQSYIKQTANNIALGVKSDLENTINITAKGITSEVRQTANYYCTCLTSAGDSKKYIRFTEEDYDKLKDGILNGIIPQPGFTVSILFDKGNDIVNNVQFIFGLRDGDTDHPWLDGKTFKIKDSDALKTAKGENLVFVYNGTAFELTTLPGSYIKQTAENIEAKVVSKTGKNEDNSFSWNLTSGGFFLNAGTGTNNKTVFAADKNGITINGSGTFTGIITASGGDIAGWKIGDFEDGTTKYTNSLYRDTGNYRVFLRSDGNESSAAIGIKKYTDVNKTDTGSYSFYVQHDGKLFASDVKITGGSINVNDKFKVNSDGVLTATGANITGIINAQAGGTIGGWNIGQNNLTASEYGFIGLYSNYPNSSPLSIAGSEYKTDWRIVAGDLFGVDKSGNLYCSSGRFSGNIGSSSNTSRDIYCTYLSSNKIVANEIKSEEEEPINFSNGFRYNGSNIYLTKIVTSSGIYHLLGYQEY